MKYAIMKVKIKASSRIVLNLNYLGNGLELGGKHLGSICILQCWTTGSGYQDDQHSLLSHSPAEFD